MNLLSCHRSLPGPQGAYFYHDLKPVKSIVIFIMLNTPEHRCFWDAQENLDNMILAFQEVLKLPTDREGGTEPQWWHVPW
jgi:hypothetical protein